MTILSLILVMSTPIWIFVIQALGARTPGLKSVGRQKMAILYCLIIPSLLTVLISAFDNFSIVSLESAVVLGLSVLLGHVYFHLYNMSETARRIHILVSIKSGTKSVHAKPTNEQYSSTTMLSNRLVRLVELNQIESVDGKYVVKQGPLLWAAIIFKKNASLLFPGAS